MPIVLYDTNQVVCAEIILVVKMIHIHGNKIQIYLM